METVSRGQVGSSEFALPPRVQEALGQLVSSAQEGLLALSVGVGLGVLAQLMEEEVVEVEYEGTAHWGTTVTRSTVSQIPLSRFRVFTPVAASP